MSETKSALIIANYRYEHSDLRQLVAPAQDAESLARVLADPGIGGFQVRILVNEPSYKVSLEIESFCDNRKRDDLLLLYFSGHGITDATDGQLYFATIDTQLVQHNPRRATAVPAQFVNEVMSRSRSRRQILLLDCCYSGAFKEGMLAKGEMRASAGEKLQGQGRVVLTASDAFQYSFEGEQVQGTGTRSIFTDALVHGLETGEADLDRDGFFSLDEVYDYIYGRLSEKQPGQKPMKMGYAEGKIFIGNNPHPLAAELAPELRESLEDRRPWVRLGALQELEKLLVAGNKGLVLAAQAALASLAKQDDSQEVRKAAEKSLAAQRAGDKEEADLAIATRGKKEKAEANRIAEAKAKSAAQAKAEGDRKAAKKAEPWEGLERTPTRPESARPWARALLLYVPSGSVGWLLHVLFFICVFFVASSLIAFLSDPSDSDPVVSVVSTVVFCLSAEFLRRLALRNDRRKRFPAEEHIVRSRKRWIPIILFWFATIMIPFGAITPFMDEPGGFTKQNFNHLYPYSIAFAVYFILLAVYARGWVNAFATKLSSELRNMGGIRSALLLYRPNRLRGWLATIGFYSSVGFLITYIVWSVRTWKYTGTHDMGGMVSGLVFGFILAAAAKGWASQYRPRRSSGPAAEPADKASR